MKTGDIIKIEEKELAVLKTHFDERKNLMFLIEKAASMGRLAEDTFWNTVHNLYPEVKGFDIHLNWIKNELTIRGKKQEIR